MKRTPIFQVLFSLLTLFPLLVFPAQVLAQQQSAPVNQSSMWGEVVDQNGNIRYDKLSDLGTVQQSASWMPSIPGIGSLQASYHEYQTPKWEHRCPSDCLHLVLHGAQPSGVRTIPGRLAVGFGCGHGTRSSWHHQRDAEDMSTRLQSPLGTPTQTTFLAMLSLVSKIFGRCLGKKTVDFLGI